MEPNVISQFSVVTATLCGVGSEGIPASEVVKKGDHGLGTFEFFDGEMVMVDGQLFQMKSDGGVYKVQGNERDLPFVQVTRFRPTRTQQVEETTFELLGDQLRAAHPHADNVFLSIRISGTFRKIVNTLVEKQRYPGQPGTELMKKKKTVTLEDVSGTIFGFRSPQYMGSWLTVPGLHLHFVSSDRQHGGHVAAFEMVHGNLDTAVAKDLQLELPTARAFNETALATAPVIAYTQGPTKRANSEKNDRE